MKIAQIIFKRVGRRHGIPTPPFEFASMKEVEAKVEEYAKSILHNDDKAITVTVVDPKQNPMQGHLDYGLTGEFTVEVS